MNSDFNFTVSNFDTKESLGYGRVSVVTELVIRGTVCIYQVQISRRIFGDSK